MVVEVGDRPVLNYVTCLHETHRVMLLTRAVREQYDDFSMLFVVRVAASLSKAAAMPSHVGGAKGLKSDFVKRCAAALKALDEHEECDITKLPVKDQQSIREILGGKGEPYQGCFSESCLDKEPAWITLKVCVRCAHCDMPMSFGRTWRSGRDQIHHELDQLFLSCIPNGRLTYRFTKWPKEEPLPEDA